MKNSRQYWNNKYEGHEQSKELWTWDRTETWKVIANIVLESVPMWRGWKILDLGCGIGACTRYFAQDYNSELIEVGAHLCSTVGIDRSDFAIEYARKLASCRETYLVGEVDNTGLPSKSFHVVIANEILEHMEDPNTLLEEAYRLLVDSGILVITTPHDGELGWDEEEHCTEFTHDSLYHLLIKTFPSVTFYTNVHWFSEDDSLTSIVAACPKGKKNGLST